MQEAEFCKESYKEPWDFYPEIWKSKQQYFTWLRGQLRKIWNFYPAKLAWKKSQARIPPMEYTGKAKKLGECYYCKNSFPISSLEVDHEIQAGKCNSWESSHTFLEKLLNVDGNWLITCKPCHKIKSYAEAKGISFDDARHEKDVIAIMKLPVADVKSLCTYHGYSSEDCSSDKKRKLLVSKILKGSKNEG